MKKTTKLKALVLSAMMLACMLVPTSAKAQNDSFLPDTEMGNRGNFATTWAITNNSFQDAPLGSGLLILTAVGAGYVALKKKEERQ